MRKTLLAAAFFSTLMLAPAEDKKPATTDDGKVKDPVCGMTIDKKTAEKADYKGKTYYFCSREEKADFQKNPEKYAAKKK